MRFAVVLIAFVAGVSVGRFFGPAENLPNDLLWRETRAMDLLNRSAIRRGDDAKTVLRKHFETTLGRLEGQNLIE